MFFLLPPSEGKKEGGFPYSMTPKRSFNFVLPKRIALEASPKDLKCKDKRYDEGIALNTAIFEKKSESYFLPAIQRYTGVMFNAIGYDSMSENGKKYMDDHVLMISGLYGLVKPQDLIENYKLPITSTGLYAFWGKNLINAINTLNVDKIYDLLPGAHKKVLYLDKKDNLIDASVVKVDFFENGKKLAHGVKGVKGAWMKMICEDGSETVEGGIFLYKGREIEIVLS